MLLDAQAVLSSAQAITVTAVSTGVYDITGYGVGNPAQDIFGQTFGTATSQASDIGGGGPLVSPPMIVALVGTAFTAGGAATLTITLQSSADTTNTGTPASWTDVISTNAIAVANLTAGAAAARFTIPPRTPGQALPRFYRLNYTVATGPMLTGTMNAYVATGADNGAIYSSNF